MKTPLGASTRTETESWIKYTKYTETKYQKEYTNG